MREIQRWGCVPKRLVIREDWQKRVLYCLHERGINLLPRKKRMHCSPNGLKYLDGKRADLQSGMKHCWPEQNIQSKVNITKYISDMSYWEKENSRGGSSSFVWCSQLPTVHTTRGAMLASGSIIVFGFVPRNSGTDGYGAKLLIYCSLYQPHSVSLINWLLL